MKKFISTMILSIAAVLCFGAAGIVTVGENAYAESSQCGTVITSANLSLDDNIYVYLRAYYDGIDIETDDYGMIFWKSERDDGKYTYANAVENENAVIYEKSSDWSYDSYEGKDVATYKYEFAAKEMTDVIYAESFCVKDGEYFYSDVVPYGVCIYAERKLGKVSAACATTDEKLKTLLEEMLRYGAAAQIYFDYKTDKPATYVLDLPDAPTELTYFLDWDGEYYVVTGMKDENCKRLVIPATYEGLPVKEIQSYAFGDCLYLEEAIIPDSITKIAGMGFANCRSLKRITVNENNPIYYSENNCIIENGTKKLVVGCNTSIIPQDVEILAMYAFDSLVSELNVPASVNYIENGAVYNCPMLTSLKVDENNSVYYSQGNCIIERAKKKLVIGCSSSVIPQDVASIGWNAFEGCSSLTAITIPDNVTSIGGSAFSGCKSLKNITIPDNVISIGESAFRGCINITSIEIGKSVENIGRDAFQGCKLIESIVVREGNSVYYSEGNCLIEDDTKTLILGSSNSVIPQDVVIIGKSAFSGRKKLTAITIPDSVTSIEENAFDGCTSLTKVEMGNGVMNIGPFAFLGCTSITEFSIPDSVLNLNTGAFWGCSALTEIIIPDSVTSLESQCFYNCSSLSRVIIGRGVTVIEADAFWKCKALESVLIGENVETISEGAFAECLSLKALTIPESVKNIEAGAFGGCDNLIIEINGVRYVDNWIVDIDSSITDLVIKADTVGVYDAGGLAGLLRNLNSITVDGNSGKYYSEGNCLIERETKELILGCNKSVIPKDVISIGKGAFQDCKLIESVVIGNEITSIGERAFKGCTSLSYLVIGDNVTSIGSYAFFDCSSLESLNIGVGVTSVGEGAFCDCSSLTSVTIPESLTSISEGMFSGCTSLASITIPNNVIHIGNYAFGGCFSLTSVEIPESVTSIGEGAFNYCKSLNSITISKSVTSIGDNVFNCSDWLYDKTSSNLNSIIYNGSKAEWKAIIKGEQWKFGTNDFTVFCIDGELTKDES